MRYDLLPLSLPLLEIEEKCLYFCDRIYAYQKFHCGDKIQMYAYGIVLEHTSLECLTNALSNSGSLPAIHILTVKVITSCLELGINSITCKNNEQ